MCLYFDMYPTDQLIPTAFNVTNQVCRPNLPINKNIFIVSIINKIWIEKSYFWLIRKLKNIYFL